MKLETKIIETKRLILRPFQIEDAGDMFRNYASDPDVTKYLSWPVYTEEAAAVGRMRFMEECYAKGNISDWAIELKSLGQVIGGIDAAFVNEAVESVQLGYCIGKPWWHQGITTEAMTAVLDYFFREAGVNRVEARHARENPNSGKVLEKCGLRYEGTLRASARCNAGICDAVWYGLLREEYFAEKGVDRV